MERLQLIRPTGELEGSCLALRDEFRSVDNRVYQTYLPREGEPFTEFLRRLHDNERGHDLLPDVVAQSIFWLVRDGQEIVGQSALRHTLTPMLEIEGGHIGYAIRPGERKKGYGTRILALTLEPARAIGLQRVLVTCNTENTASARIIQQNGGVFEGESLSPFTGKPVSRYWIDFE